VNNTQIVATHFADGLREPHYFNGRLLAAEDLQLDQATGQKRLALLGQAAGYGVVDGLIVSGAANTSTLKVTRGLGLNRAGQLVRLAGDVSLALTLASGAGSTPDAGSFLACNLPPSAGGGGSLDSGVYLLTATPISQLEGQVAYKGAGSAAPGCAARWETDGLQFAALRLTEFDLSAPGVTDQTLRNLLAHWCFGTASLRDLPVDPFHFDDRYGGLDRIASTDLGPTDLPLVVFYWKDGALGFLDLWSARRRLIRHAALDPWPGLPGDPQPAGGPPAGWQGMLSDRRVADAQARFLQFQDQLDGLLAGGKAASVKATDFFRYLPPAGFLPIRASVDLITAVIQKLLEQANQAYSGSNVAAFLKNWAALTNLPSNGFDLVNFFGPAMPDHIGILEGESVDFLLQRSWYDMPIDLSDQPRLDLYLVRENWEQAIHSQLPQVVQRVLPLRDVSVSTRVSGVSAASYVSSRTQPAAILRQSGRAQTSSTATFLRNLAGQPSLSLPVQQLYAMFVKQVAPVINVPLRPREVKGPITLWHSYSPELPAGSALTSLVAAAQKQYPNAQITATFVPANTIFRQWQTARASGSGPDLVLLTSLQSARSAATLAANVGGLEIVNNVRAGDLVRAGMVLPLDTLIDPDPAVDLLAYRSLTVDGKLYGLPQSYQVVGLYYKTANISNPPATTDDLLKRVREDLLIIAQPYYAYGFFMAFGGKLMDSNGRCTADQGGFSDALDYWRQLQSRGTMFAPDSATALKAFADQRFNMFIEGSWWLGQIEQITGAVGIAPLPSGPAGPSRPLVGVDAYFVDAGSANTYSAAALAQFLTDSAAQSAYADQAKFVPVRSDVQPADSLLSAFHDIATQGESMPQNAEFLAWWQPFQSMIVSVLGSQNVVTKDAVAQACQAMNQANGKR